MDLMGPFHLAIGVHDLSEARVFYGDTLGCTEGRSADKWVDYDFFGHQLSLHLADREQGQHFNPVDGDAVPIPHFGCVLPWAAWHDLTDRLSAVGTTFLLGPRIRFKGEIGEQATFFIADPSGNALEFKAFRNPERLFASA